MLASLDEDTGLAFVIRVSYDDRSPLAARRVVVQSNDFMELELPVPLNSEFGWLINAVAVMKLSAEVLDELLDLRLVVTVRKDFSDRLLGYGVISLLNRAVMTESHQLDEVVKFLPPLLRFREVLHELIGGLHAILIQLNCEELLAVR